VKPQVEGKLIAISFTEGQEVTRGHVLAKIDPTTYQAQYDQAVATKAQREAQLANAKLDLERYMRLAASNAINKQQVDTQRALVAQLEAQTRADQAAIDNTRAILSYRDHGADRRAHRHPPGGRGQYRATLRHHRARHHHANPADFGAVQLAAAIAAGAQQRHGGRAVASRRDGSGRPRHRR
jgi:multidrug efflux pump subunit AcrA (membrane-fusion protein)